MTQDRTIDACCGKPLETIISTTLILAIIGIAIVGCLSIFGVLSMEQSKSMLIKTEAALLLLGGCAALIALVTGKKKESQD